MKKIFICIIFLYSIFTICGCGKIEQKNSENLYPQMTVVINIDKNTDIVTCEDFNHIQWQFYGCEDWAVGDIAAMIMDNNNTEIIYDDIIVSVKYDGWIDGWF